MTNICENDRCTYHKPLPVKDSTAPYIDTIEGNERVRVNRYLYQSRDGKRQFFLCDVCHAAVKIVVTPNTALAATVQAGHKEHANFNPRPTYSPPPVPLPPPPPPVRKSNWLGNHDS